MSFQQGTVEANEGTLNPFNKWPQQGKMIEFLGLLSIVLLLQQYKIPCLHLTTLSTVGKHYFIGLLSS